MGRLTGKQWGAGGSSELPSFFLGWYSIIPECPAPDLGEQYIQQLQSSTGEEKTGLWQPLPHPLSGKHLLGWLDTALDPCMGMNPIRL